jgi:hypothetical protein
VSNLSPALLDELICVCCKRDALTWGVASQYIVRFISAKRYKVYVPDGEIAFFKSITPGAFEVLGESIFTQHFSAELKRRLPARIADQFGWYLQQLIKLYAVSACEPNELVLIWDADTVPIRSLNFIDDEGKLVYYKSDEHHPPYFETIARLLGLGKKVDFSFIAQCFVLRASWFDAFCHSIEERHQISWPNALLDSIDFEEGNGFSEYETLGTFISHHYPDQITYSENKWLRLGNSTLGHIAFLSDHVIAEQLGDYDFVSFEKWDRAKPYYRRVAIPYFFKVYLRSLFKKNTKVL